VEDGRSDESLGYRKNALEEAFFAKEDERLRQRLREADQAKSRKKRSPRPPASPTTPCRTGSPPSTWAATRWPRSSWRRW
jgi:hypothetical protein